jgi:GNAT superfamily N-acetyltransferase
MEYPQLDLNLARRLETAEAQAAVQCAELVRATQGDGSAAVAQVAGGYAIYCGADSPVTQAVGIGLNGLVSDTDFDQLEEFYFTKKEPVRVETCPLAHPTLMELYGQRGYRVTEFSNMLLRPVDHAQMPEASSGVEVRRITPEEIDLWALTVAQGFAEAYPVTDQLLSIVKMFSMGKNTECYLARVDGKAAGGATLALRGKIAGIFGASTLPQFRNRGVQTELLRTRMRRAAEEGCDLAMSLAQPGSASQRNIVRQGFQVLYTRVKFERAVPR